MAKKITKKTLRFAPKTSYLLNENTPFVVTESFRKLKASLPFSHCMPITPSGLLGPVKLVEY